MKQWARTLADARRQGVIEEMAEVLRQRYFKEWAETTPFEEGTQLREQLFHKVQILEETLTELFTIIDTESGDRND